MEIKVIISLIIVLAGIGLIFKIISVYYFYSVKLKRWGTTEGKVLESGIEYFRSKTDSDTEGWIQKVIYSYKVEDINYTNDKITNNIKILLPSESSVKKNSDEYLIGDKINVYYNKNNPQESFIDGSFNYFSLFYILIGITAFFVANYIRNEL